MILRTARKMKTMALEELVQEYKLLGNPTKKENKR